MGKFKWVDSFHPINFRKVQMRQPQHPDQISQDIGFLSGLLKFANYGDYHISRQIFHLHGGLLY